QLVLNTLVGHALWSGADGVISQATPWRPLVHTADIARAFTAALDAPREAVHDRAFNIGSEANNVTVAEIAEQVAAAVAGSKVVITGETGADPRSYRVDFSRFRAAVPGFDCAWTVKQGAVELADAYRHFGLTREDFEGRFTRLAVLRAASETGAVDDTLRWRR
ncbi:NAD-dependent epimerase/dehydratase family protein, partial [Streptomyces olivaceus]|uniref:NAD-dependent epimerase/dehydratase family protein n=1 Tax=Streptomyces olivaceus TaxID=47716 RepID=UPI0036AF1C67